MLFFFQPTVSCCCPVFWRVGGGGGCWVGVSADTHLLPVSRPAQRRSPAGSWTTCCLPPCLADPLPRCRCLRAWELPWSLVGETGSTEPRTGSGGGEVRDQREVDRQCPAMFAHCLLRRLHSKKFNICLLENVLFLCLFTVIFLWALNRLN